MVVQGHHQERVCDLGLELVDALDGRLEVPVLDADEGQLAVDLGALMDGGDDLLHGPFPFVLDQALELVEYVHLHGKVPELDDQVIAHESVKVSIEALPEVTLHRVPVLIEDLLAFPGVQTF